MSPKQQRIMDALRVSETITLDTAVLLIGGNIYANAKFHVGNVLSNMVKRGMILRIKPGLFGRPEQNQEPDITLKP
jgi:hypothetical protein